MTNEFATSVVGPAFAVRCAMIDAAGIARIGGADTLDLALSILETLSASSGGWLPENVIREEGFGGPTGKIVVLPR